MYYLHYPSVPGFDNLTEHNGLTLEKLSKFSVDLARTHTIGLNITESKPINFKGNAAYKIIYTELDPKNQIVTKHMIVDTLIGHNGYFFEYGGEVSNYEQYLPIAEYMINSFDTSTNQK